MRLRASVLAASILAWAAFAPLVHAQTQDPAVRQEVAKLLEMTGTSQMAAQAASMVAGQILDGLRSNVSISPRAIDVAKEVLDEEFKATMSAPDGLMTALGDVYARHFTIDDIKGLVAFYSSDLGKKIISALPKLMQESMQVAQEWTAREMPRIQRAIEDRLKKEGLIKK